VSERLESIKYNWKETDWGIDKSDINWLIEQAESVELMVHVIKVKNKEMRELSNFLKERKIPLKELSPLVIDYNHNHIYKPQDIKMIELKKQNKRYRESIERATKEYNMIDVKHILHKALNND